jgi:predicted ATPase
LNIKTDALGAFSQSGASRAPCQCEHKFHDCKLIVITGGPGAGKTAVLKLANQILCEHVVAVPEAATIVFGGGFWRKESLPAKRASQRAIYHVQHELETILLEEKNAAIGLCDRGTIDGLAYWPGEDKEFWLEIKSTHEQELDRYAAVIHLRTPNFDEGYNHSNPVRIESAKEALRLDERIYQAWRKHPNRVVIESTSDFMAKAYTALQAILAELPSCCKNHSLESSLKQVQRKI